MKKYTAKYFDKTTKIIEQHLPDSIITLQFFQRKDDSVLAGMEEVLTFLNEHTDTSKYEILSLKDGTIINNKEVVLQLKGKYKYFGIYEGLIDGILARNTSLATNAHKVRQVANGKEIIFMGDRTDHYSLQATDGKAIALGGISTQVTDEQVMLHEGKAVGTMPHALIQAFKGDLIKALHAYKKTFPNEKLTALVDFNNDVITDSIRAFKEFGSDLYAVRVDTSEALSDAMFLNNEEYGVTPNMIKSLRNALNMVGANEVKIIVSSGFNVEKIKMFEDQNTPVDIYGVGGSLLKINNTFTADAIEIDGIEIAKVGRGKGDISKLK